MAGVRPPALRAGQRFGKLLVLDVDPSVTRGARRYICRCDCGRELSRGGSGLRLGRSTSCGCGRIRHGMAASRSPTYRSWEAMLFRCTNPSSPDWGWYGGRGITVCDGWRDFTEFLADMGERPAGRTLDRIDSNGPYCKVNCRWATAVEQAQNRRNTSSPAVRDAIKKAVAEGRSQSDVARQYGLTPSAVSRMVTGRTRSPKKGIK